MFLLFFLLLELPPAVYSIKFQVISWELKPYIWTKNGRFDGILPFILQKVKTLCSTKKYSVNVSYSLNLITMKNFDNILANTKPKYGEGNVKNITVDKADPVFWFPYPVSIREKKNNPILLRHLKVYNFVYASSISTIMSRNHL